MSAHNHRLTALLAASGVHLIVRHEFFRECFVPDECSNVDLIIPAIEDREVLLLVEKWARLKQIPLAFGRDDYALTNYVPGRSQWVATLIFCADNQKDLAATRNACYKQIRNNLHRSVKIAMNQGKTMQDQDLSAAQNSEQENQDHDPAAAR